MIDNQEKKSVFFKMFFIFIEFISLKWHHNSGVVCEGALIPKEVDRDIQVFLQDDGKVGVLRK